jgi:hypothetical protein
MASTVPLSVGISTQCVTPRRANRQTGHMKLTLNNLQLAVLQWVADGCDMENPPTPTFKMSAPVLHDRGLIELDRRSGHWTATLNEKGAYYLEHGRHPDSPPPGVSPSLRADPTQTQAPTKSTEQADPFNPPRTSMQDSVPKHEASAATGSPAPPAKDKRIQIPAQIRKPHLAVRELIDHKERLEVPAEQRQRALLILHALVQEASRRGWSITPVLSEMRSDSWTHSRTRTWPSNDLFNIDAGHKSAAVRLRMKQRQVTHVPTADEIKTSERWGYQSYSKNDLVPTETMRLEIGAGSYGSLVLEDTVATRIEDKLLRGIERIQLLTEEQITRDEQLRLREIEEAEARAHAEILRQRATTYSHWVKTLEALNTEATHHKQLLSTIDRLSAALPRFEGDERYADLQSYLEWAEEHLADSDPLRSIPLPNGDRPDLAYSEWSAWNSRNAKPRW